MKKMMLLSILLLFIIPAGAGAQSLIAKDETLDLARCIEIALIRHPGIQAAANTVKADESRVGQAKSGYYPQVSATASYSRADSAATTGRFLVPSDGSHDNYASSVALSQNLFDFGKTATQVKIQNLNVHASRWDVDDANARVIFGVKQAYYGLLLTQRNRDLAREVVGQFTQHLGRAKGFFEVGLQPKFDVTRAEVDLSNAKLNLLRAENALRLARITLNNAMGLPDAPNYEIQDSLAFQPVEVDLEQVMKEAYDRRPDLQSILAREKSLDETITFQKKGYMPFVTGSAGYGWGGERFPLERGWNIGATLNIPLFSGFSTRYQVDEARANLDVLKANEEQLRQAIFLEVKQAWLNLQEASDRIVAAEVIIRQAGENLELVIGRYAAGVGSPIEVTDALVAESNAKTSYIAALYDYKIAQATLERATGYK